MTDELGFGPEKRRQGNLDILAGKVTFRCVLHPLARHPIPTLRPQGCLPRDARERLSERSLVRVL